MNIVFISDTHTFHREMYEFLDEDEKQKFNSADAIIHTGDFTNIGSYKDVISFLEWMEELPHKYKIIIAGNHDFFFDTEIDLIYNPNHIIYDNNDISLLLNEYPSVIYLNNTHTYIDDIKVWGSPINLFFGNWAFNRRKGSDINKYWDMIPDDTDIIMTHGPVFGILDEINGEHVGDEGLLSAVDKIKPKIFVSGHIHEQHGIEIKNGVKYINSSILDDRYKLKYKPIHITI